MYVWVQKCFREFSTQSLLWNKCYILKMSCAATQSMFDYEDLWILRTTDTKGWNIGESKKNLQKYRVDQRDIFLLQFWCFHFAIILNNSIRFHGIDISSVDEFCTTFTHQLNNTETAMNWLYFVGNWLWNRVCIPNAKSTGQSWFIDYILRLTLWIWSRIKIQIRFSRFSVLFSFDTICSLWSSPKYCPQKNQ